MRKVEAASNSPWRVPQHPPELPAAIDRQPIDVGYFPPKIATEAKLHASGVRSQELTQFGIRDLAVLVLSAYVLIALTFQTFGAIEPAVHVILDRIDFAICVFFLIDFAIRFSKAPSKGRFLRWGWIDLISSIPVWDPLRLGRAVRVVRILRVLRIIRSGRQLMRLLFRRRVQATVGTAALAVLILLSASSVAGLVFERESSSAIKAPADAIWWAVSTITIVGYGDVPVTIEGKIIAMVLMVAGIALFGVFTGLVARLLISSGADIQAVGKWVDLAVGDEWNGREPRTRIVAIGANGGVDGELLREAFDRCQASSVVRTKVR